MIRRIRSHIYRSFILFALLSVACLAPARSAAGSPPLPVHSVQRPKIGLVLSGGGSRGLAHVGVLKALEQHNIPIDIIVGSSIGAIIGGLYAAGYTTEQLTRIIDTTEWNAILSLSDGYDRRSLFVEQKQTADRNQLVIRFDGLTPVIPSSISTGQNLSRFLDRVTLQSLYHPERTFDDFKIAFRAIATDMISGKRIVIDSGNLSEAMRASVGVPFLYSSVKKDSMQLIDGGLSSNIPVDVARSLGADVVIAVDVTSPLRSAEQLNMPWEIADQIIAIMAQSANRKALGEATVVISPLLGKRLPSDFTHLDSLIRQGEAGTADVIPRLRDSIAAASRRYPAVATDTAQTPLVRSVTLTGVTAFAQAVLVRPIERLLPAHATCTLLRRAADSVLTTYRAAGYCLARVHGMRFDDSTGAVVFDIDEGIIDRIAIEGNTRSRDWVIRRELPFTTGDVFTFKSAERAIGNLLATNLFEQAFIDFRYEDDRTVIVVKVAERRTELIRLGIRIDNERNGQPMISLRDENILGSATEAGFAFAGGLRNRSYEAEIKTTRIFNSYFNFKLTGGHSFRDTYLFGDDTTLTTKSEFKRQQIGEYRTVTYAGAVAIGRQVERLGVVSLEYRIEGVTLRGLKGTVPGSESYSMHTFRFGSTIDALDRSPFPRSGSLLDVAWETSSMFSPAASGFSTIYFSYQWFNSYSARHTLRHHVRFGYADKTTPLSQQFSLGGESMLYGTREDDRLGRQLLLVNVEYRVALPFRVIWETYASLRYDIGAAWPEPENIRFIDMQHGIGAGLAIDSPIGPVSLSAGRSFVFRQNVSRTAMAWGPTAMYFSIGYPL